MKIDILYSGGRSSRVVLFAGACICSLSPILGQAQTAPPADSQGLEELIVTAQRREERLQDVPAAVSAFSGAQLEQIGIESTKDLTQITPGFFFAQAVFSPQPTIRGIGVRGVGAGDESVVPVYIDGVYQPFIAGAALEFNNIERVEVLKGPQGALFGRNAMGGAINVITETPTAGFGGAASFSYGRFNEKIAKAYVSGGIEKLAGDVALVTHDDDGYVRDVISGDEYAATHDISVRSKLRFVLSERAEFTFTASYIDNHENQGEASQAVNGNTIAAQYVPRPFIATQPYRVALSSRPFFTFMQRGGSVIGTIKFEDFDLHTLTGMQWDHLHAGGDSDNTPLDIAGIPYYQFSRNLYQEVYATSNLHGSFSWIAGAVYYKDVSGYRPLQSYFLSPRGILTTTRIQPTLTADSRAGYLQGTYDITDALSVTVGGRFTSEDKGYDSYIGTTRVTRLTNHATFDKFTPDFIVQYRVNPQLNLYAKAGQAFKSGIFNAGNMSPAGNVKVNPETVTQYEIGAKADPTHWLRVDVAGYYTDYRNLQSATRDPVTLAALLQNAGTVEIYGLEAESLVKPVRNLDLHFGVSAMHGQYTEFPAAQVTFPLIVNGVAVGGNSSAFIDAKGKNIIRTPFFTANFGGDYRVPLDSGDVTFSGNLYYNGKMYWDIANRLTEKPYTLVNLQTTWDPGNRGVILALWVENLLNRTYDLTLGTSTLADSRAYAKPRTYGARVSYAW